MADAGEEKKSIPPYVAYKTFSNFLDRLKVGIPSRIDRGLLATYSGGIQAQLLSTLKSLDLTTPNGLPTEKLKNLVNSDGADKAKRLNEIIKAAYSFLFRADIDLASITYSHLEDEFKTGGGVSGGTIPKCIAFFVAIAKEAGIELSPYIKVKALRMRGTVTKRSGLEKNSKPKIEQPPPAPPASFEMPSPRQGATQTWEQLLLAKFPEFDPAWPNDVKTKWFEGFKELMDSHKKG